MKLFWLMGPTEAGGGASAAAVGFCEVQGRRQMLLSFPSSGFSPGDVRRAGGTDRYWHCGHCPIKAGKGIQLYKQRAAPC